MYPTPTGFANMIAPRPILLLLLVVLAIARIGWSADVEPSREAIEHFENSVRPLLAAKCWKCHAAEKQQASLRLDSASAVATGGDSGPAIVPGDPEHSPMIQAVRYGDEPKMPPDGKLADSEIAILTTWVKSGAPWPKYPEGSDADAEKEAASRLKNPPPAGEPDPLWAFRPMGRQATPTTKSQPTPKSPIDRFILATLEAKGLSPARRPIGER